MELFERIRLISKERKVPLSRIAAHLGQSQQNFNKWFDAKTQRRFWEHLPAILELFPDVRPEWLYMGQEPAFQDGTCAERTPSKESLAALEAENAKLRQELDEERAINRKLLNRLLLDGVGDKREQTSTGEVSDGQK